MSFRETQLDGARGIAALAVVFSHVAAVTWLPSFEGSGDPSFMEFALWHLGAPAVDFFFILSGYVVAGSLLRRGTGPGQVGEYLLARIVRLLPIAYVGVLLGLLARQIAGDMPLGFSGAARNMTQELSPSDMVGLLTMTLPVPDATKVNGPLWTLVVEMQAAWLMPIFVLLAARIRWALVPLVALAGWIGFMLTGYGYLVTFTAFALGAVIRTEADRLPTFPRPGLIALLGLAVLLSRHWSGQDGWEWRLVTMVGGGLTLLALRQGVAQATLNSRPAQWLGDISYSLYATHFPVMMAAVWLMPIPIAAAAAAGIPAAIVLAWIVHRLIERPAISWAKAIRTPQPRIRDA